MSMEPIALMITYYLCCIDAYHWRHYNSY